jgi:hypothetical protein
MICVTDCKDCKNRLPKIDGWLACCKAFPNGRPKNFDYSTVKTRKECNNGIGYEPKEKERASKQEAEPNK